MKEKIISILKWFLKVFPEKYREYYQILIVYKVNKFSKAKRHEFLKEIEYRKTLSIFDVDALSQALSSYSDQYYYVNSRYAIAYHLSQYAQWKKPINAIIEHGVYYDNSINEMEVNKNKFPAIFTFGPVRYKFLSNLLKHKKEIYALGPHIEYVDGLLNVDELSDLKSKLGRVLLAIPSHSIESHNAEFDYNSWISEIKDKGKDFDTIMVNVYFQDVIINRHQHYLDAGFKVVTSGHRSDLNFLPRLKSILSLSDMTMSNSFSTAVGYCLHLNKPHYIYKQSVEYKITDEALDFHADTKLDKVIKYSRLFTKYSTEITEEQMEVYNKVWGGKASKKSPEDLHAIFKALDHKKPFWL